MNKKLRKLISNPQLFVVDAAKNRFRKFRSDSAPAREREKSTGIRYSVISAVYGVEQYLEQYFNSMVKQTMNFNESVELIMVDDGSLDGSAAIVLKWQAKYPNNIHYIKQENGGQAAARNTGIPHARGEWITFIDPDDFVDKNYFGAVSDFLTEQTAGNIGMVSCNFIFYIENTNQYNDAHPLKYRFAKGNQVLAPGNLGKHVQLSVNSAFFRRSVMQAKEIRFNPAIRPCFEDAHFVGQYLLHTASMSAGFCAKAKYYYRKREDGTSTLDGSWAKPAYFTDVLRLGCVDLAKQSLLKTGTVPEWLQRTILYHLFWSITKIVGAPAALSHLTDEQKNEFKVLTYQLFSYIKPETVMAFDLAGCWFFHKVGLLGMFYDTAPPMQISYVDAYDDAKEMVQLRYFVNGPMPVESIMIDGIEVIPAYAKSKENLLFEKSFVTERLLWVRVPSENSRIILTLNDKPVRLSLNGKQHPLGLVVKEIVAHFTTVVKLNLEFPIGVRLLRHTARSPSVVKRFHNSWIFMDRDTVADDNAEHLYRYVQKHHPQVNAYFVLSRKSPDWDRLRQEGFRLLAFGSLAHKHCLLNAEHVVSSHADAYVVSYLPQKWYKDMLNFKYTFLQHGVTKDDLATWLNTKDIGVFVTSTVDEHESICGDGNRYKFTRKNTVMSGMPRHDALLNSKVPTEKLILIMPTWRLSLAGRILGKGAERAVNPDFYASAYATQWKEALHSQKLRELSEQHGFKIIFFPHPNVAMYLDWFEVPAHVEIMKQGPAGSMQAVFRRAAMLVTDYSSVAFEMALLDKPTVYFQFDRATHFSGGHTTEKGYYDYDDHGFGPCVYNSVELADTITFLAKNSGMPPTYQARVEKTFVLRDGQNCQRTFEAIAGLNAPDRDAAAPACLAISAARTALMDERFAHAKERWEAALKNWPEQVATEALPAIAACTMRLGQRGNAHVVLKQIDHNAIIEAIPTLDAAQLLSLARSYRFMGFTRRAKRFLRQVRVAHLQAEVTCEYAAIAAHHGQHQRAIRLWHTAKFVSDGAIPLRARLDLANATLLAGDSLSAAKRLKEFERRAGRVPESLLLEIEIGIHQNNLAVAKALAPQLAKDAGLLPTLVMRHRAAQLLYMAGMKKESLALFLSNPAVLRGTYLLSYMEMLFASGAWYKLLAVDLRYAGELEISIQHRMKYQRALASFKIGKMDEARKAVAFLYEIDPECREYLHLYGEVCHAMGDWEISSKVWQLHLELYPDQATDKAVANLLTAFAKLGKAKEAAQLVYAATKNRLMNEVIKKPTDNAKSIQLLQLLSMPFESAASTAQHEAPKLSIIKNM
ncbi:CDP-glycerol glycerophosphotransferase family protein [Noviherbaspirillum sp. 1P10PC]|uniref:CDP-glycerol glycerophosphotransferase family protein n=1 Tax=Noviherbaspirillum sp. 1P10PC TaxID=3132292 RepID=UPI0039A230BF